MRDGRDVRPGSGRPRMGCPQGHRTSLLGGTASCRRDRSRCSRTCRSCSLAGMYEVHHGATEGLVWYAPAISLFTRRSLASMLDLQAGVVQWRYASTGGTFEHRGWQEYGTPEDHKRPRRRDYPGRPAMAFTACAPKMFLASTALRIFEVQKDWAARGVLCGRLAAWPDLRVTYDTQSGAHVTVFLRTSRSATETTIFQPTVHRGRTPGEPEDTRRGDEPG
ncbi:uncharacterized protein B0H18DRAFT_639947 [Fomitopsis serialis]|uniref:uncharacterized protein n=1 Tax=Fomitopsis serialis TaxID=139415 RepID=UPI002007C2EA|nr:uncharacterized protein B0H18DRAFT_639947 [Neoantrodia serialis]KAH9919340.1 hypothetical protein B0H18DRAFT_639947 [Neoantrodia serialis]